MGEIKQMNVAEKLMTVQTKLKAPKTEYNAFGKYKFRSAESILKALKPLLAEVRAIVTFEDTICYTEGRHYVHTKASFMDVDTREAISTTALAREEENKKGASADQVTGGCSSYARKFALNGMFLIDDSKDSDLTNDGVPPKPKAQPKAKSSVARDEVLKYIKDNSLAMAEIAKEFKLSHNTTDEVYISTLEALKARA